MPIGSVPGFSTEKLGIDDVLEARKRHEVSAEAVLLRAIRLTSGQYAMFCASTWPGRPDTSEEYLIDYGFASKSWQVGVPKTGEPLPKKTIAAECVAIGYTAKGYEDWGHSLGKLRVECVGVPSYPNQTVPRVLGIVAPVRHTAPDIGTMTILNGDATQPRGSGSRIIAQVVNDGALTWGGGMSLSVRKKWPAAQQDFRSWATSEGTNLRLGNVHLSTIDDALAVASLVAQHGYGPSPRPRIRYSQLEACLEKLSALAMKRNASVHIPRLGCGQAGAAWSVVSELIQDALCSRGVKVFVYDLPGAATQYHPQGSLNFKTTGA
jgi:O-acetyl-ADP-ribose deacetylase (regulator of RNase III)